VVITRSRFQFVLKFVHNSQGQYYSQCTNLTGQGTKESWVGSQQDFNMFSHVQNRNHPWNPRSFLLIWHQRLFPGR